ncbi:hypothetical protein ACFX2C_006754 [Malus domestica]
MDQTLSTVVGLLSLEPDNSPEWLLRAESALLATWLGPFRLETDLGELELLLVTVAMPPFWRVCHSGESEEVKLANLDRVLINQTCWLCNSASHGIDESRPSCSKMGFTESSSSSAMYGCEAAPRRRRTVKLCRNRCRKLQKQQNEK